MLSREPFCSPTHQLVLIGCFAKATWTALGFAFVCLALDVYAIVFLPHHHRGVLGDLHPNKGAFPYLVWTLEIILALLALWLIRFAFSRGPRLTPSQLAASRTH